MNNEVKILPFSSVSDSEIKQLLTNYQISLTVEEAKKVSQLLKRDPTVVEAVIWGIQGSEHCSYKSSKRFLKKFTTDGRHVILPPGEDSGIVAITDEPAGKRWGLVIAHESHNHPSQIVPYEGAATGIGGVVRDVLCMGARVVGCLDALRLGDLKTDESKSIASEIIRGIGGYGNPLGIPNLGGDTVFSDTYNNNCLVNAIALGIVREDEIIHSYVPQEAGEAGYDIILIGKPTDRSGFGGASFASLSLEEEKKEQNTGAVQEPNPFLERHLLASTYALFDWLAANDKLNKVSFKDLGAGGVVCASVEQVSERSLGAIVYLDQVHTSIKDLPPEVIACAETQERLCWMCHPDLTDHIIRHYNETWQLPAVAEGAQASLIGKVTNNNTYKLVYKGNIVCEAKALAITCGLQYERPVKEKITTFSEPDITLEGSQISVNNRRFSLVDIFETLISDPNNASKKPVFVHYDKNVIGNTITEAGEADAGVIAPLRDLENYVHEGTHPDWDKLTDSDKKRGVAVAADGNSRYGLISPYWQGVNASLEAMRNVVAAGAAPRALTDCLNYGNPEIPEQLWELQQGVDGIAEVSKNITFAGEPVPVISGNVSLYNSQADGSSITPTAVVSCIGVLPDISKTVNMQLKQADSFIYLIGERKDECGGSAYYEILKQLTNNKEKNAFVGSNVPKPDFTTAAREMQLVIESINLEHLLACHDISEGGLLLALFEMTLPQRKISNNLGLKINLDSLNSSLRSDTLLFAESGGFVCEVKKEAKDAFENLAKEHDVKVWQIGQTEAKPSLSVTRNSELILHFPLHSMMDIWENGLVNALQ